VTRAAGWTAKYGSTAQAYGKTSGNVVQLEVLTYEGERFWAGAGAEPTRGCCEGPEPS
jgi:hypothetical protein